MYLVCLGIRRRSVLEFYLSPLPFIHSWIYLYIYCMKCNHSMNQLLIRIYVYLFNRRKSTDFLGGLMCLVISAPSLWNGLFYSVSAPSLWNGFLCCNECDITINYWCDWFRGTRRNGLVRGSKVCFVPPVEELALLRNLVAFVVCGVDRNLTTWY